MHYIQTTVFAVDSADRPVLSLPPLPPLIPAAMLLLTVQLLLCFAVAVLWANTEEEQEEEGSESKDDTMCYKVITDCDLKKQKLQQQEHRQQGEWASLAEEGRGLYEKLLSYT